MQNIVGDKLHQQLVCMTMYGLSAGTKKWLLTAVASLCSCCFERLPLSEQSEGYVCLCSGVVSRS